MTSSLCESRYDTTPTQDIFGIYKAQWGFLTQRRETDWIQLRGLPTWRCRVHNLKPLHPQKVEPAWFIVAHPRPGVDYICMICAEYPCIQEMVQIWRIGRIVNLVCKKHDVATRSSWVNYVSSSPNIVRGEVETDEFVVIYEVLIQQHEVSLIAVEMMEVFIIRGCSNTWLIRTRFLAEHRLNSGK